MLPDIFVVSLFSDFRVNIWTVYNLLWMIIKQLVICFIYNISVEDSISCETNSLWSMNWYIKMWRWPECNMFLCHLYRILFYLAAMVFLSGFRIRVFDSHCSYQTFWTLELEKTLDPCIKHFVDSKMSLVNFCAATSLSNWWLYQISIYSLI